jgi:hypothetical protein
LLKKVWRKTFTSEVSVMVRGEVGERKLLNHEVLKLVVI